LTVSEMLVFFFDTIGVIEATIISLLNIDSNYPLKSIFFNN